MNGSLLKGSSGQRHINLIAHIIGWGFDGLECFPEFGGQRGFDLVSSFSCLWSVFYGKL